MATANENTPAAEEEAVYPIRTISSLTGVNAVTLRAWERRYGLIRPHRTPKGHRLYTERDLERIKRVLELLDQGVAISQASQLLDRPAEARHPPAEAGESDVWQQYQARMLGALEQFDEAALDGAYNDALSLYPVELVNTRLVTPLLRLLGQRWKMNPGGVAQEHFFSVYLRNKLGARIHHLNVRRKGQLLLIACLPGEQHEIGMLMFALAAVSHGYPVLLLGANLPIDQIPTVLQRRPCAAVVLSGSTRPARGLFPEQLRPLVDEVSVPVFVGGAAAERYEGDIEAAGAIALGEAVQPALQRIAATLASRSD
ncbi:MAG: MerR family transcriptional regulator [Gammaproteobacteria bacterium]|jgi:DNA-binding transcriptional MerR regulator